MKKIKFTVEQWLLLQEVRETVGYSSVLMLDLLDENENPETDVEVTLSQKDIEDIVSSVQRHLGYKSIPEEDISTANKILELLGGLPEEVVQSETEHNADGEVDDYPGPDKEGFKRIRFLEEEYKYQVFLDGRTSSFFQNLKYLSTSIKNYKL